MKTDINVYTFATWFADYRPNQFSPLGRIALFDMITGYEQDTGEEIEFDPVAFCCEYTEYHDMEEFWTVYDKEDYPDERSIMDATHYFAFGEKSFIILNF